MKLIVDTNILLSTLIKDSTTRKIIIKSNWDFYYPEMSFHEIRKHKDLVLRKSCMTEKEYSKLLDYLLEHVNLVPDERLSDKLKKAKNIMAHIDPDDVVFVATQLAVSNSSIWSDDKDFDRQDKVKVLKTHQINKLFNMIKG